MYTGWKWKQSILQLHSSSSALKDYHVQKSKCLHNLNRLTIFSTIWEDSSGKLNICKCNQIRKKGFINWSFSREKSDSLRRSILLSLKTSNPDIAVIYIGLNGVNIRELVDVNIHAIVLTITQIGKRYKALTTSEAFISRTR